MDIDAHFGRSIHEFFATLEDRDHLDPDYDALHGAFVGIICLSPQTAESLLDR